MREAIITVQVFDPKGKVVEGKVQPVGVWNRWLILFFKPGTSQPSQKSISPIVVEQDMSGKRC